MAIHVSRYVHTPRRIQAGGIDAGVPRAAVSLQGGGAAGRTAEAVLQAGKRLTDMAVREYVKDETVRVSQSLLAMQEELSTERERYMREHQGEGALDAGEHFAAFARQTAQTLQREGKFSGRFAEMFATRAAGMALHFTEQGQHYGRQQKALWHQDVVNNSEAAALDAIAADYANPDYYAFTVAEHEKMLDSVFAGQDSYARKRAFRKRAAASAVQAALAAGDREEAARLRARFARNADHDAGAGSPAVPAGTFSSGPDASGPDRR